MNTANMISDAFAQFALLSFVPSENAHTNIITNPTKGIAVINMVMTQSFTDIGV